MKRLGILALLAVAGLQAAPAGRNVFVNMGELFERCKAGVVLQREATALQKDLQDTFQKEQAKLAKMEKDKVDKSKLESEARKSEFTLAEKRREAEAALQERQQKFQKDY